MSKLDMKQQIYETAKSLFYQDGYSATTMRKIAQASGSSVGLSLYYFGSKENLGVEIYKEFRLKLRQACLLLYPEPEYAMQCRHLTVLADAALLLETPTLKDLFVNVANSQEMGDFMYQQLTENPQEDDVLDHLRFLNSLTVSAVKANIINANLEKFSISITNEELLAFLFHRYIRLQEPEQGASVSALFHSCYGDYQKFHFRVRNKFQLEYDTEFLKNASFSSC